jgi:hypothetical protein
MTLVASLRCSYPASSFHFKGSASQNSGNCSVDRSEGIKGFIFLVLNSVQNTYDAHIEADRQQPRRQLTSYH